MNEVWKNIDGYEGKYQISNLGRVKSLQRWSGTKYYNREQILNNYVNKKNGYVYVYLTKNNKSKNIRLHKIVADAFIPNPNNLPQINHKDGNKQNNCFENLEWCSCSYNIKDMYRRHGKYENDKIIIDKYKALKSCSKVGKLFGLSGENIRQILIRNNIERNRGGNNDAKISGINNNRSITMDYSKPINCRKYY